MHSPDAHDAVGGRHIPQEGIEQDERLPLLQRSLRLPQRISSITPQTAPADVCPVHFAVTGDHGTRYSAGHMQHD